MTTQCVAVEAPSISAGAAIVAAGPARPSLRARLLAAYIRLVIKPRSRDGFDVAWARRVLEPPLRRPRVPGGFIVEATALGGVSAEIIRPREPAARTIFFLHGGGYYFGCSASYRALTFALATDAQAQVVAIDYRRAPEHPFPAALDDATAAFAALATAGVSPAQLAVCGDSAGGGLALSLLLRLRDAGRPLPACAVLFSPWTDLAATGASIRSNSARDPLFHGSCIGRDARHYLAGTDACHPAASPLYAELAGLPPLLIQVSRSEVLLDDSVRLAEKAMRAGVAAQCQVWTDLPHVWQLQQGLLPEARLAVRDAAQFIRRRCG